MTATIAIKPGTGVNLNVGTEHPSRQYMESMAHGCLQNLRSSSELLAIMPTQVSDQWLEETDAIYEKADVIALILLGDLPKPSSIQIIRRTFVVARWSFNFSRTSALRSRCRAGSSRRVRAWSSTEAVCNWSHTCFDAICTSCGLVF